MSEPDFELEVNAIADGDYDVAVLRSPGGQGRARIHFPFNDLELKVRLQALELALLRSGGQRRAIPSPEEETVREFGRALFDTLFEGDVRSRFDASIADAERRGEPLRIKLRFNAPELATLPWEFLFDRRQPDYLVLSASTPLVRYVEIPKLMRPITVNAPLRMLGMVASPKDLDVLDVARERGRIEDATAELREGGLFELRWLEQGTFRELQQALWGEEKWHIFHFAGHGGFDPKTGEGLIAFADEIGNADLIRAAELGRLLGDHRPLRLAVLNACEGARGSNHDLFSSTAATLVRRGTPAVIAMQYEISDAAAKEFGRTFYEAVAASLPVDVAMVEARKSVAHQITNSLEWGTPVLFMRSPDGVLFKVRRPASSRPEQGPARAGDRIGGEPTVVIPSGAAPHATMPTQGTTTPASSVLDAHTGRAAVTRTVRAERKRPWWRNRWAGLVALVALALAGGVLGIRLVVGDGSSTCVATAGESPATFAHTVGGQIREKFIELGAECVLGYPTTEELDAANGGRYQDFQNRTMYWHPVTGAHSIYGAIFAKFQELGAEWVLGYPTTEELDAANGGRYQNFQNRTMYWHPVTGAHSIYGANFAKFQELGAEWVLGYPTAEEETWESGRRQTFEKGTIFWTPTSGAWVE